MKKLLSVLLLSLTMTSVTSYAKSDHIFSITKESEAVMVFAPGDTFHNEFTVTNDINDDIRVKLDNIDNLGDAELYDALVVNVNGEVYDLASARSEWFVLTKNQSKVFTIDFIFPEDCNNKYQDKIFKANLRFRCESPDHANLNWDDNHVIVQTGDTFDLSFYGLLFGFSLFSIFLIIIIKKTIDL